jgi:predicted nucleic acid-binding protein
MILPMRKVISNTTPILSLIKIEKLDILKELYGQIMIPEAVFNEMEVGKDWLFYTDLSKIDWIRIEPIQQITSKLYLFDLDAGEAEVIILAQEQKADLVIMDEIMGRRYAKQLGLKLTGTLGILLRAKEKGLIDDVAPLISNLIKNGVWISPELIKVVLKKAGELRSSTQ